MAKCVGTFRDADGHCGCHIRVYIYGDAILKHASAQPSSRMNNLHTTSELTQERIATWCLHTCTRCLPQREVVQLSLTLHAVQELSCWLDPFAHASHGVARAMIRFCLAHQQHVGDPLTETVE